MFWSWLQRFWRRRKPKQHHVDFSFDSSELGLSIDDFARNYLDPAIETLAAQIDVDGEWRPAPWHKRASLWLGLQWLRLWSRLLRRKAEPEPEPEPELNINMITAKALTILHQKVNAAEAIRDYKPGSVLRIRLPVQYTVCSED